MIDKKALNFSYIQIFLILSYLICWFSISTSFDDIQNFIETENNNLSNLLNFLRQSLNLFLFPILIIIFFKKYQDINLKRELLFIFLFFYFIFQVPGLFLTKNSIMNLVYVVSALNILLIFILSNIYFDEKKYSIFFYITFIMLSLITILNYKVFVNFFASKSSSTLYTFFFSSETFLGKNSPRSTGSSRTLLIMMIMSFFIFKNFFYKYNFFKIAIFILISTIVLLFQSRTTIVLLIIYILINYIYEKKFSLKETLKYFGLYFIVPIIFLNAIITSKYLIYNYENINFKNNSISKNLKQITTDFKRPIDPKTYSSGRVNDWKDILSKIDRSIIYGYGAQSDRFLINQTASNGLIYAIASSGILGIINFVSFSLLSLWIVIKNLLKNFKLREQIDYLSSVIVLLILFRSILESSYAVFSVDFIVIYTFINYLNKFSLKNDEY